jgi:hypothetical protein
MMMKPATGPWDNHNRDPDSLTATVEFVVDDRFTSPSLEIYDSAGRLLDLIRPMSSLVTWLPEENAPNGVYFARLRGDGVITTVKFIIVR